MVGACETTLATLHCAIFGHGLEVSQLRNLVWLHQYNTSGTKI